MMRWSERQLTMLREIGVVVPIWPAAAVDVAPAAPPGVEPRVGEILRSVQNDRPSVGESVRFARDDGGSSGEIVRSDRDDRGSSGGGVVRSAQGDGRSAAGGIVAPDPRAAASLPAAAPSPARADWLVVADIDSADEAQLLAHMLRAIDVSEGDVDPAVRAARVDPRATDLVAAIASVRPRIVLALGRTAAHALLGSDEPLGQLRGRVHAHGALPVVVTWPPVFLLRHPEEKARAWADLCLAVATVDATGPAASSSSSVAASP